MKIGNILEATDSKEWRAWLAKHHKAETEIWLVFYKKGSGKPRISGNDAVMEALSYGWIDSTVKSLDSERLVQRFSKRKKTSGLSQMNRERIRTLIRQKKMTKAGLAAVSHVFDHETDKPDEFTIPPDILIPLKENEQAWKFFQKLPESYRRIRIAYIESRKRHGQEQFQTSLKHFIKMTAKNKRIGFVKEMK